MLIGRFLWDVVVASVHVGWLASGRGRRSPRVARVRLVSDSDLLEALTGLAVSLVPGSLIIDADSGTRTLTIHVLDAAQQSDAAFAGTGAGAGGPDPAEPSATTTLPSPPADRGRIAPSAGRGGRG